MQRMVDKIIIHCSDTKTDMDIGAAEIRKWHKARGWVDIGYHFVIRRDGRIESGRDTDHDGDIFEEIGAHTYGYNKNSIGICMVGGMAQDGRPENNFTKDQWKSLESMVRMLKLQFPKATVHGHREFANKACPCFDVQEWLKRVNI